MGGIERSPVHLNERHAAFAVLELAGEFWIRFGGALYAEEALRKFHRSG